jgi:hypothetical protein
MQPQQESHREILEFPSLSEETQVTQTYQAAIIKFPVAPFSIPESDDAIVSPATPAKRKRGKSLSRRTGQSGHIEKSGRWYVVRYWKDIGGQEKRQHVRERICPISGPGSL